MSKKETIRLKKHIEADDLIIQMYEELLKKKKSKFLLNEKESKDLVFFVMLCIHQAQPEQKIKLKKIMKKLILSLKIKEQKNWLKILKKK